MLAGIEPVLAKITNLKPVDLVIAVLMNVANRAICISRVGKKQEQ